MAVGEHDVEMAWPLGMAFFGRNKSPFEERQAAVMHTFLPSRMLFAFPLFLERPIFVSLMFAQIVFM